MPRKASEQVEQRSVTTWILGGLGNQLFQYAIGFVTASQTKAELFLDSSAFRGYLRNFELLKFGIQAGQPPPPTFSRGFSRQRIGWHRSLARLGVFKAPKNQVVRETSFGWQPIPLEGWTHLYLRGYWQSPKYFEPFADPLRRILSPSRFLNETIFHEHRMVRMEGSIAVHIRRGDYVSDPQAAKTHGILSKTWYDSAIKLVRQVSPNGPIHVFSDDPKTGASIADGWGNTIVHASRPSEQDLLLISSCQHKIIANSTFSWWGAWLSEREGLVVAPRQWFAKEKQRNTYVNDLFPDGWILL